MLSTSALPAAQGKLGDTEPSSPTASRVFPLGSAREIRFRALVERHFAFVWRSVRRFGVTPGDVDDAAQEVLLVAARRLDEVMPERERAFLFATAARVAATRRRSKRRHPEELDEDGHERPSEELDPAELAELSRARPLLQEILDAMGEEFRAVFILAEIEELTVREIAELLAVPQGTVSSRLRTARERFQAGVKRLHARAEFGRRPR